MSIGSFLNKWGRKVAEGLGVIDPLSIAVVVCWVIFFPALWVFARFHPRRSQRILFWTNEGYKVAPSRVRCYHFSEAAQRMKIDTQVLSFWDHLARFEGLPPFTISLGKRTYILFQAMMAAVHSRAGIIFAQRPFYDFLPLISLKLMYGKSLNIWIDIDDWIFDNSLDGKGSSITFRDTLPIYALISCGCSVASGRLRQEMNRYFDHVELLPTFPDSKRFRPLESENVLRKNTVVVFSWIGTILMDQVVDDIVFLAKALESVEDTNIVFEIVGDGFLRPVAEQRVAGITRHTTVSFRGWVDPDKVVSYINGIDVGLYCLRTETDFTRSKSPTKLFEYMACAKPTVSTDFGEAPRFIEHGITGFLAKEKQDFVDCCRRLAQDPELRMTMGRNARRKIEKDYNLQNGVKSLINVLLHV